MIKYEAVLFDFDGTLVNSKAAVYQAYLSTFKYFNPSKDYSHIENIVNQHLDYDDAFKAVFYTNDINPEVDLYLKKIYMKLAGSQTQLFEGVHEIVKKIEALSYPWGIVTSKKRAFVEQIIKATGLSTGYACLICEEDIRYRKPHPEPLIKACKMLNKNVEKVVYIGDALTDIQAAKACGMDSIAVSYGYGSSIGESMTAWGATYVISELDELASIILNDTQGFAPTNTFSFSITKNKPNELGVKH